jgi:hypothetical protein
MEVVVLTKETKRCSVTEASCPLDLSLTEQEGLVHLKVIIINNLQAAQSNNRFYPRLNFTA